MRASTLVHCLPPRLISTLAATSMATKRKVDEACDSEPPAAFGKNEKKTKRDRVRLFTKRGHISSRGVFSGLGLHFDRVLLRGLPAQGLPVPLRVLEQREGPLAQPEARGRDAARVPLAAREVAARPHHQRPDQ